MIIEKLKDPDFWFTVIIVGLVLNVVGAFAVRLIDQGRLSFFKFFERRSEKRKKEIDELASLVGETPEALNMVRHQVLSVRTNATLMMVWAVFSIVLSMFMYQLESESIVWIIISGGAWGSVIMSLRLWAKSNKHSEIRIELQNRLKIKARNTK